VALPSLHHTKLQRVRAMSNSRVLSLALPCSRMLQCYTLATRLRRREEDPERMNEHTVKSYEEELTRLDKRIAQMGGLAEQSLGQSFDALERRDPNLAELVVKNDRAIDTIQREIEEQAVLMIARRQPLADDLRRVLAALRIAGDLERIGDLAKNIAKRALAIATESHPKPLMTGLRHMGELALAQLKEVLDAYAARDATRALAVWNDDAKIDAMYNSLFREMLTYMMEDPRNIGISTHLLFGAKNIERVGDHTTNIAETVYYLVHATAIADDRPKEDRTASMLFSKRED
jgi:phosphate transport system protein